MYTMGQITCVVQTSQCVNNKFQGPLVFKGGCDPCTRKQGKRAVFPTIDANSYVEMDA